MHNFYVAPKKILTFCSIVLLNILAISSSALGQKTYANSQTNQVNGLCLLCGVNNPNNPVNNSNLEDYSTFIINVGLLGVSVEQTLIFPTASAAGCDSLIIGIGSGNPVLSANLFGGVTVETYNGSTSNNDSHVVDSSVLQLLQCNSRGEVLLRPQHQFDRVKIRLSSSLVGLLNNFRLYYAYRKNSVDNPIYYPPEGMVCGAPFIPILNHQPNMNYNVRVVYTAFSNLILDTSYTVINRDSVQLPYYTNFAGSQGDIYIQAVNNITGCKSDSVHHAYFAGSTSSLPRVDIDSVHICKGDSATLHAVQVVPNALYSIIWYSAPTGGTRLHTGPDYTVSPATTTTYYVTAKGSCEYPQRIPVKVTVTPRTPPTLARDTLRMRVNTNDTLVAIAPQGATFTWYATATGGSPLFNGSAFPVHPVTLDTLYYYVESLLDGCVSSSRTQAVVIVSNQFSMTSKTELPSELKLHPNPTTGEIKFQYNRDLAGSTIILNNMNGVPVYQHIMKTNIVKVPDHIPAGIYLIKINTMTGKILTGKIIIQK
ncbi:T9SS type A sorting domain-containing protein [Chitinophaga sp. 22536]|uniref:Ig-like domain-containing protein n=1 Tax=unclassified Chitinophaga TaxID=2619133 RepID=UPI003F86A0BC